MAERIHATTTETNVSSSSDDELERGSRYDTVKFEYKNNNINENDWSSSDDDDDDEGDDDEITHHHKEPPYLQNLDWITGPYSLLHVHGEPMNQYDRRKACFYREKLLSIRHQLSNDHLILRPRYKETGYHLESIHTFDDKVYKFMTQTGIYIDDVFFTCNQSEDKVKEILDAANNFHPNIELEYKIGKCAPFLDVYVENNNGNFVSSVYHKPSTESTVLSFLYDHPRHVFRNVIQTSLNRAIRYSSTFDIFNHERRAIRLMLLYNR
ncbi:unnamed protein product [Rotaria sp. Silwood2]|nr:unnamed protein product [Rotaria sp. Silwood2]